MMTDIETNIQMAEAPIEKDNLPLCLKLSFILLLMISTLPIGISSVYFAYTDDTCVNYMPEFWHGFTMKTYLLVDGFYNISMCIWFSCITSCMSFENNEHIVLSIDTIVSAMLPKEVTKTMKIGYMVTTIMAGCLFWGFLQPQHVCSSQMNHYLMAINIIEIINHAVQLWDAL